MVEKEGKLETVFYWTLPVIFTGLFMAIIFHFLGIPFWKTIQEWGNEIPLVEKMIPDPSPEHGYAKPKNDSEYWKKQLQEMEGTIQKKDQKINSLSEQVRTMKRSLDGIRRENEELADRLEGKQNSDFQVGLKKAAALYTDMPESKAASILSEMPLEEAALTISQMYPEQQSNILEKMKDAEKAALIGMLLKEIETVPESDPLSLKQRLKELAQKKEKEAVTLYEAIETMPADLSASVMKFMFEKDSEQALQLMKTLKPASRSLILREISKTNAEMAKEITAKLN